MVSRNSPGDDGDGPGANHEGPPRPFVDRLKRVMEAISTPAALLDTREGVALANGAMRRTWPMGSVCTECFERKGDPAEGCPLAMGEQSRSRPHEEFLNRGGHIFHTTVFPLVDEQGSIEGCVHLAQDVTERKREEEALLASNRKLEHRLRELDKRSQDINLLSELGRLLQTCESVEDTYLPITWVAEKIFPRELGALFLREGEGDLLKPVLNWGAPPLRAVSFSSGDCLALRAGEPRVVEEDSPGPLCPHAEALDQRPAAALCVPIGGRREIQGLLYVHRAHGQEAADSPFQDAPPAETFPEERRSLAEALAERVSLAVTNLRLRAALHELSVRDPLTGLFNRRFMDEFLEREIARSTRASASVAVIMADIDHFKVLNDTHGHDAGDAVLAALGRLFQSGSRKGDVPCRFGGEEFVIIMPGASAAVGTKRAEELLEGTSRLQIPGWTDALVPVTFSVGVAVFPDHGNDPQTLLRAADQALYQAKAGGRARVVTAASTPQPQR